MARICSTDSSGRSQVGWKECSTSSPGPCQSRRTAPSLGRASPGRPASGGRRRAAREASVTGEWGRRREGWRSGSRSSEGVRVPPSDWAAVSQSAKAARQPSTAPASRVSKPRGFDLIVPGYPPDRLADLALAGAPEQDGPRVRRPPTWADRALARDGCGQVDRQVAEGAAYRAWMWRHGSSGGSVEEGSGEQARDPGPHPHRTCADGVVEAALAFGQQGLPAGQERLGHQGDDPDGDDPQRQHCRTSVVEVGRAYRHPLWMAERVAAKGSGRTQNGLLQPVVSRSGGPTWRARRPPGRSDRRDMTGDSTRRQGADEVNGAATLLARFRRELPRRLLAEHFRVAESARSGYRKARSVAGSGLALRPHWSG